MRLRISVRGRVRPSVQSYFRTTNMAVYEGEKSSTDIINSDTISDDAVPPRYLFNGTYSLFSGLKTAMDLLEEDMEMFKKRTDSSIESLFNYWKFHVFVFLSNKMTRLVTIINVVAMCPLFSYASKSRRTWESRKGSLWFRSSRSRVFHEAVWRTVLV